MEFKTKRILPVIAFAAFASLQANAEDHPPVENKATEEKADAQKEIKDPKVNPKKSGQKEAEE